MAATLVFVTQAARAQPPAPASASNPGVLLLRNGQIVEGRIERLADHYQVTQPDQELRIRITDVEFLCRDLEDGYQRKRSIIQPGNIQEHLQLAHWCQRHGLLNCAANELAAAVEIDPSHPMIAVLQRRLKMAMEKSQEPDPAPARPTLQAPSGEELDRMVRGMPSGTVETFVQSIQPILMNHCMTSGCHGLQAENRLQLMRAPLGQPTNRRVTQRNLHAVLQWINWENPGESRLLTIPRAPHGSVQAAIFTDRQVIQYRRLTDWVYRVTQKPIPTDSPDLFALQPSSLETGFKDSTQPRHLPAKAMSARPMPRTARQGASGPVSTASALEPAGESTSHNTAGTKLGKSARPSRSTAVKPGGPSANSPSDSGSTDPFDPAVFNSQLPPQDSQPAPAASMPTPAAKALHGE